MPFTEKICPSCHKSVPVDTEQEESFCIYCGNTLTAQEEPVKYPEDAAQQDWEKLFDEEEYEYIINTAKQYVGNEDDPVPGVYYFLAKLKHIYGGYHDDITRQDAERGLLAKVFSNFSKSSSTKNSFHEKFFNDATQLAGELAELLNSIKSKQAEFCQTAANKALGILIIRGYDYPRPEMVAYQALEKNAIQYFSLLSDSDFENLFGFYKKFCKQNFFAREVIKALKQEQKARKVG